MRRSEILDFLRTFRGHFWTDFGQKGPLNLLPADPFLALLEKRGIKNNHMARVDQKGVHKAFEGGVIVLDPKS